MNCKYSVDQHGFVQVSPPGLPVVMADRSTSSAAEVHSVAIDETGRTSSNPKDIESRGKCQLHLLPTVLMRDVANALNYGAVNRGRGVFNWRGQPISMSQYVSAILRHMTAIMDGEDIDKDSGVSHLGCIAANCGIVLDAQKHGTLIDDRPKP